MGQAAELDEAIGAWTSMRSASEVVALLREQEVPVSRINSIADVVADPQIIARDMIVEVIDDRMDRPLLVPESYRNSRGPRVRSAPGPGARRCDRRGAPARRCSPGIGPRARSVAPRGQHLTFRGPIGPDELGVTLIHEHIFVRNPELELNLPDPEWSPFEAVETAVHGLSELHDLGVRTVVDLTVPGLGRDVRLVREVADRVQVNLVAATGWYTPNVLPVYLRSMALDVPSTSQTGLSSFSSATSPRASPAHPCGRAC